MNLSDAVNPSTRCQRWTTGDVFLKVPANSRVPGQQTPGKATLSTNYIYYHVYVIHIIIINRDFHKQKLLYLAKDNLLWPQITKGVLVKRITAAWSWINLAQHCWTLQKWLTIKDLYFIFPVFLWNLTWKNILMALCGKMYFPLLYF